MTKAVLALIALTALAACEATMTSTNPGVPMGDENFSGATPAAVPPNAGQGGTQWWAV